MRLYSRVSHLSTFFEFVDLNDFAQTAPHVAVMYEKSPHVSVPRRQAPSRWRDRGRREQHRPELSEPRAVRGPRARHHHPLDDQRREAGLD